MRVLEPGEKVHSCKLELWDEVRAVSPPLGMVVLCSCGKRWRCVKSTFWNWMTRRHVMYAGVGRDWIRA